MINAKLYWLLVLMNWLQFQHSLKFNINHIISSWVMHSNKIGKLFTKLINQLIRRMLLNRWLIDNWITYQFFEK
jgi:hypothetical protein